MPTFGLVRLRADDRGDILLGWLTRIVVFFSIAGVIAFDAISISSSHAAVADEAAFAARAGAVAWQETKDVDAAYAVAQQAATEKNPANKLNPKTFVVEPAGSVRLTMSRTAKSIAVHRFDATASWAAITKGARAENAADF